MRIGFDAKRLYNNFTGLGNYSRTLVRNLAEKSPDTEIYLYTPKITDEPRIKPFLDTARYHTCVGGGAAWRTWTIYKDIEQHQLDIFHGLSHEIPFSSQRMAARTVVTMHDLIFKIIPSDYAAIDRLIYDRKCKYACTNADLIIAISESTKKDVMKYYRVDEDKIQVIYQSCDPQFFNPVTEEKCKRARAELDLPESYFLNVGSVIPRKNLGTLVEALAKIPEEKRLPLVVLGSGKSYLSKVQKKIAKLGLAEYVHFHSDVPFDLFPAVYKGATAMIYPSRYEGFGIPVIEALAVGTPVITSNTSSMPEAGGNAAIYVSPKSTGKLAKALVDVSSPEFNRQNCIAKGMDHVRKFDEQALSDKLLCQYHHLLQ